MKRNLAIAGAAVAAGVSAVYSLWLWLSSYIGDNFHINRSASHWDGISCHDRALVGTRSERGAFPD